jgi:hypothetical protein
MYRNSRFRRESIIAVNIKALTINAKLTLKRSNILFIFSRVEWLEGLSRFSLSQSFPGHTYAYHRLVLLGFLGSIWRKRASVERRGILIKQG